MTEIAIIMVIHHTDWMINLIQTKLTRVPSREKNWYNKGADQLYTVVAVWSAALLLARLKFKFNGRVNLLQHL